MPTTTAPTSTPIEQVQRAYHHQPPQPTGKEFPPRHLRIQ
jgi:hypothetical protein